MSSTSYAEFLASKADFGSPQGFEPIEVPDFLFPFQVSLVSWAIRQGRAAIFASCGLGKTPCQLVWADNVIRHTNRPVLVLTPLAVSGQTVREGQKFGIDVVQSRDGTVGRHITVTNYEQLKRFNAADFSGVVCDESSAIKNADTKTKAAVVEFARTVPYRLLCTATPAPNDYIELGTSSECLGYLGYQDMITRFFKQNGVKRGHQGWGRLKYVLRGHAERDFWRWVCSWARSCRQPSDLGFKDDRFILPELRHHEHMVVARTKRDGFLFDLPARTFHEQREEQRRTIGERCEKVAELVAHDRPSIVWAHLNDEGDLAESLIPDAIQVSGSDSDEVKEDRLLAFADGKIRVLVSKAEIAGFGMNFQICAHQTFFPSYSFERYFQAVRRSWRFGQDRPVDIDIITTDGEVGILGRLREKAEAAEAMFEQLVSLMDEQLHLRRDNPFTKQEEIPSWLAGTT